MMRSGAWLLAAGLALVAGLAPAAWTQEVDTKAAREAIAEADPDAVDPNLIKGEKWTLDLEFQHPEAIVVNTPDGGKQVYWYVFYTVTNNTPDDRMFVPSFTLVTDNHKTLRAGIHATAFEAIKARRKIRFLENAVRMHGKVLTGPDNAKTGVAIFTPLDRETDRFTLYVEGLSGLYVERPKPGAKPDAPAEEKVVRLRKTLAVEYELAGDKWWLNLDQPKFLSKKWTWR